MDKETEFQKIYDEAVAAGLQAGEASIPTPMVVGTPKDFFSNEIDTTKKMYYVSDGVCGFAWVNVKPGTSSFAKWLVKKGYAKRDSYYGGVTIWISDYNQSMTRKEAHAHAMAKVFTNHEIRAQAMSRMD